MKKIVLLLIFGVALCGGCVGGDISGPQYPFDNSGEENWEMQQDLSEEGDFPKYDPPSVTIIVRQLQPII